MRLLLSLGIASVLALAGCAAHRTETPTAVAKSPPAKPKPQPPASGNPVPAPAGETGPDAAETSAVPTSPAPSRPPEPASPPAPSATESSYVFAPQQAAVGNPAVAPTPAPPTKASVPAPGDAAPGEHQDETADTAPRELQLAVVASASEIATGAIVTVDVMAASPRAVVDAPFHLTFDPNVIEFVDGTVGDFLAQGGSSVVFFADGQSRPGDVAVAAGRVERTKGASGAGLLCRVRLRGTAAGATSVTVGRAKAWGVQGEELTVLSAGTSVVVR